MFNSRRTVAALIALAVVVAATLAQGVLFEAPASSATIQACQNLSQQLGSKVALSRLDLSYITSLTAYYNQNQAKRSPACIVYPASTADVQLTIKEIRKADARFAVKAGSHNFNVWSSVDQGVQIDLSRMMDKTYDAEAKTGFYEPGNRWRDLYKFYGQHGYVPVGGRLGGVGSGLALGGGLSYLSAQYGLACDSFIKLDVVLPDGSYVQATRTNEHKELFMTLQGGANIIGIVTGYHVQLRPVGTFTSGNLIYSSKHSELVVNVTRNFTVTNKDSKAAVITTINKLFLPDLSLGLDEFVLLFLVYDGDNPGDIFKDFEAIPHVLDTRRKQTYSQLTAELDIGTVPSGAIYSRVIAIRPDSEKHIALLKGYRTFAKSYKGLYTMTTIDFQPVPKMLTDASRASGGNALGLPDGPYTWVNTFINYVPSLPKTKVDEMLAAFDAFVDSVPNDEGLPLFLNDAGAKQPVLQSYGNYARMQQAKRVYDPQNYFSTHQDGPSIEV